MKKSIKSLSLVMAMLLLAVSVFVPTNVYAASGKKSNIIMYVGESYEYTNFGIVKSVKNTNKTAVKANKKADSPRYTEIHAKKPGKAKITIKTTEGTKNLNITVKAAKFSFEFKHISKGEILVTVTNNTKAIFSDGRFRYTLKGTDGTEYVNDLVSVFSLIPGKKNYAKVFYNNYDFTIDTSKCSAVVENISRSPNRIYKDAGKKVKVTDKLITSEKDTVNVSLNIKNLSRQAVSGVVYVIYYDKSNNIINTTMHSVFLREKAVDTTTSKAYLPLIDPSSGSYAVFDHYEVVKNLYTNEIKF